MAWTPGTGLPYDGWYGGRVDMMIGNGTYADFRPKIESRVLKGHYSSHGTLAERVAESQKKLKQWDAQWEAVPVEERIRLRNRVVDDVEIKEKVVHTARGPMKVYRSRPSCNNNLDKQKHEVNKKIKQKLPSGSITADNSPLSAAEKSSMAAAAAHSAGIQTPSNAASVSIPSNTQVAAKPSLEPATV